MPKEIVVESILVILARTNPKDGPLILLEYDKSLPIIEIDDKSNTFSSASLLVKQILDIDVLKDDGSGWLPLNQVGVFDNEKRIMDDCRIISIGYSAILPEKVEIKFSPYTWHSLSELLSKDMNKDHKEILQFILTNI